VPAERCADRCRSAGTTSVGIVPLLPGSPEIVLELYSGGANCCFIDQVFRYDPATMGYVKTEHDFSSSGAALKRLGGRWRFVSADPVFKYAFTDGADSGEPLQFRSGVTGSAGSPTSRAAIRV